MRKRCRAISMMTIRWQPSFRRSSNSSAIRLNGSTPMPVTAATMHRQITSSKIYTSKQKRRVTPQIKREMRRRSAVQPVIGHLKEDHRMGRNYLAHRHGDFNNAVLAAVGYNFRRLIRRLREFLRLFLAMLFLSAEWRQARKPRSSRTTKPVPGNE